MQNALGTFGALASKYPALERMSEADAKTLLTPEEFKQAEFAHRLMEAGNKPIRLKRPDEVRFLKIGDRFLDANGVSRVFDKQVR